MIYSKKFDMLHKVFEYINKGNLKSDYFYFLDSFIYINKDNCNRYYISTIRSKETVYTIETNNKPTIKQIRKMKLKRIL